jgi:alkylation response protein AidB-like acyl-CoA dehydrogenase
MPRTPWTEPLDDAETAHWDGVAAEVALVLEKDALIRDRANAQPEAELKLLKESGLANLLIPATYGGGGGHWSSALRAVRILARADASIAQILSYHYCNHASIVFFGAFQRWQAWFTASADGNWLWGDAVNPVDPDLTLTQDGPGYRLDGRKRFSTGAATGDVTLVMAAELGAGRVLASVVEHDRAGIEYVDDWDALGQRLSASGSVQFDGVAIAPHDVLGEVGDEPYSTLVTPGVQLGFANLYLGIADGAPGCSAMSNIIPGIRSSREPSVNSCRGSRRSRLWPIAGTNDSTRRSRVVRGSPLRTAPTSRSGSRD